MGSSCLGYFRFRNLRFWSFAEGIAGRSTGVTRTAFYVGAMMVGDRLQSALSKKSTGCLEIIS